MYALRLRSPPTNPRIFVKPLHLDMTSIVIPKRFHEHVGGEINDEVQLQDPVGNTFHLPYYYNNGDHRLGAGFFELRSVHQIETNVIIHFLYHGHGRFNIQIYDTFHNEITYRIAPQVPPQVNPYIGALHDMYVLEVPSDDESDEEVQLEPFEPAPWMEKIWQSNITSAHIHGNHPMSISTYVQQDYFPHFPSLINVVLPNDSLAQWRITWHGPHNENGNAPGNIGRIGLFDPRCLDFYKNDFIRLDNANRIHRIELWEASDSDNYFVDLYTIEV